MITPHSHIGQNHEKNWSSVVAEKAISVIFNSYSLAFGLFFTDHILNHRILFLPKYSSMTLFWMEEVIFSLPHTFHRFHTAQGVKTNLCLHLLVYWMSQSGTDRIGGSCKILKKGLLIKQKRRSTEIVIYCWDGACSAISSPSTVVDYHDFLQEAELIIASSGRQLHIDNM